MGKSTITGPLSIANCRHSQRVTMGHPGRLPPSGHGRWMPGFRLTSRQNQLPSSMPEKKPTKSGWLMLVDLTPLRYISLGSASQIRPKYVSTVLNIQKHQKHIWKDQPAMTWTPSKWPRKQWLVLHPNLPRAVTWTRPALSESSTIISGAEELLPQSLMFFNVGAW